MGLIKIQRRLLEAQFGTAGSGTHAATVGIIMVTRRTLRSAQFWAAIGLVFVALFSAAPASAASPAAPQVDHHVTADGHHDQLAFTDHAHIGAAATTNAQDEVGDIVASRLRPALLAVGLLFAAALLWGLLPRETPLVGRDPPRGPILVSSGRDVLARLCISRR